MTTFEWFLLIVVVIVVPLIVAVVVTLWTIDQANKRKRANRADAQIGVKRKAALSPEEVEARKAARKQAQEDVAMSADTTDNNLSDDSDLMTISDDTAAMEEGVSEEMADVAVEDAAADGAVQEPENA
ncbi:MAG: hypothetical protein M9953_06530 [Thermomicrobiales bacterium]|nr:hypothetical protein [Thermomicrobiales bacterium]MCO5227780.1 hypothetical protein [Thermomicrobiales bacterium]